MEAKKREKEDKEKKKEELKKMFEEERQRRKEEKDRMKVEKEKVRGIFTVKGHQRPPQCIHHVTSCALNQRCISPLRNERS